MHKRKIKVGIGFATGRKSFQQVLKTYTYSFRECGLTLNDDLHLSLLVAYDLKYADTCLTDYVNVDKSVRELLHDAHFMGSGDIQHQLDELVSQGIISHHEARIMGTSGYAAKRNALLYTAIKHGLDYLLFLDDDEYPLAAADAGNSIVWSGQRVLLTHLDFIMNADITYGYHCGYISPIPHIEFDNVMTEAVFRNFIEAISNDIIDWQTVRATMENGGVTLASEEVLSTEYAREVPQINGAKFISGSNLCINLTRPERIFPFYNPPGARGEDTFLSTCLGGRRVLRVPCYTFHDGFAKYPHLMDGVLPHRLRRISAESEAVVNRFYHACIGWIRYKPLLLYITQRESYAEKINDMRSKLSESLPAICSYFQKPEFMRVLDELDQYDYNVKRHFEHFNATKRIWRTMISSV